MAGVEPRSGASAQDLAAARLVRRVLSQWWLVAICALVAAVAGYFASSSRTKSYQATTTIQLNEIDLAAVFLAQNLQQQGQDAQAKAATNAKLVTLPRVREAASRGLGGRVTPDEIKDAVTVAAEADTTLVDITASSTEPALAARIADQVRESFVEIRRQASVGQLNDAKTQLGVQLGQMSVAQKAGLQAQTLRDRISQIDTLRAVSNGGVETVQTARIPKDPVSPSPKRDAILALFAGGLLGLGIALLRARLDDRVRDVSELEELWPLPVLGLIPEVKALNGAGRQLSSGAALEAFALARTNLRYLHVEGEVKTVVVTSALAEEGKSTVAWNLALAAAMADSRVLVIDADLRRPVVAERTGLATRQGLSEVLAGLVPVDDAISTVAVESPGTISVSVDVLPSGLVPPSPIALLERAGTSKLFAQLAADYDLVIIDSPPATVVADAKVLLEHADGAIVVTRLGRVNRGAFGRLRDLLDGLDKPVLGTIVNAGSAVASYGYSSYEPAALPQSARAETAAGALGARI